MAGLILLGAVAVVALVVAAAAASRRSSRSQISASGQVQLAGQLLRCRHCQGDRFHRRTAQLNTAGMTFLGLDWANRTATTYVCEVCGLIEWVAD